MRKVKNINFAKNFFEPIMFKTGGNVMFKTGGNVMQGQSNTFLTFKIYIYIHIYIYIYIYIMFSTGSQEYLTVGLLHGY